MPQFALALLMLPLLLVACGGSSESGSKNTPSSSDATYQAAREEADKTPVSDSLREYARQLCQPIEAFFSDIRDTLEQLEEQATTEATPEDFEDAFGAFLDLFGDLEVPVQNLRDDLDDLDVPDDLQDYHDAFVEQMEYLLDTIEAIKEDGFAALFALATEEPTPVEPPGFEASLVQECGDDLREFFDEFGSDLFGGDLLGSDDDPTATPPPPGSIGETVQAGDFALTAHSFGDPYASTDEFYQPEAGQRWVLLDVSIKNVSDETKSYGSFDFTLRDTDDFSYDPTFADSAHPLSSGSLRPSETIRGDLIFELPVDARPDLLIYEPGFFGEGRIDIELP